MHKLIKLAALFSTFVGIISSLGACSYGSISVSGDRVVVTRNDMLLFGSLRKIYVCRIADEGVTNCRSKDNP